MENRHKFLSFCQNNQFQFDTLRRAKYSSMMILHHLKNRNLVTAGTTCSICSTHNASQQSWKCETCPECNVCSACYKERGAECHEHKLSLNYSATLSLSENQELKEDPMMVWTKFSGFIVFITLLFYIIVVLNLFFVFFINSVVPLSL